MKSKLKIIKKPWGSEHILEKNKEYMLKKLYMRKGHKCSLQYHNKKVETIYVLSGKVKLTIKEKNKFSAKILKKNSNLTIKPKTIHRMEALIDSYYLEASSPYLKDVVRLEDDYKRI